LARDADSSYLELDPAAGGPMDDLLGHSMRILAHRRERGEEAVPTASLGARAPPQASLF
jgi:hypothetical protein